MFAQSRFEFDFFSAVRTFAFLRRDGNNGLAADRALVFLTILRGGQLRHGVAFGADENERFLPGRSRFRRRPGEIGLAEFADARVVFDRLPAEGALAFRGRFGNVFFKAELTLVLFAEKRILQFRDAFAGGADESECSVDRQRFRRFLHRTLCDFELLPAGGTGNVHAEPIVLRRQNGPAVRTSCFKFSHDVNSFFYSLLFGKNCRTCLIMPAPALYYVPEILELTAGESTMLYRRTNPVN